jgi:hypothetical protein
MPGRFGLSGCHGKESPRLAVLEGMTHNVSFDQLSH